MNVSVVKHVSVNWQRFSVDSEFVARFDFNFKSVVRSRSNRTVTLMPAVLVVFFRRLLFAMSFLFGTLANRFWIFRDQFLSSSHGVS